MEHNQSSRNTVLVVDDEEGNIAVMTDILEMLGYNILAAGSGQEAIAVFMEKQKYIDLVILDMIMPEMGGGKVFDVLREIDPHIKILLSSGYNLEHETRPFMERGCSGFIQKPFRIQELSRKIEETLK